METTPLATALTTYLSDPANAKAMMQTLVAAACASSSDNAGATALGGNYVHLLVDKSTGAVKFRSEADDAAVASGIGNIIYSKIDSSNEDLKEDFDNYFLGMRSPLIHFVLMKVSGATWLVFGYKLSDKWGIFYRVYYSFSNIELFYTMRNGSSVLYV